MYKIISEAIELANGLKRELFKLSPEQIEIVVCPPFTCLSEVAEVLYDSNIKLGAQNVHWQQEGAFTGEVCVKMLKDAGVNFVIIGHSERRQYFAETNENVNKKVRAVLAAQLTPIMCVGETLAEREAGKTFNVIKEHIEKGLEGIESDIIEDVVIAYEPVWAIGTGKTATPSQAQEAQKYIRDLLSKMYNKDVAGAIRIQYGGSVKPENITELMRQPDIDGALVGGASLDLKSFTSIVKLASEVKK